VNKYALIAVAVGAMVAALATIRLAAIIWATPMAIWAEAYPPLFDPTVKVDPGTERWALWLSSRIADAGLIRATSSVCLGLAQGQGGSVSPQRADDPTACLTEINKALLASPSNSELWFFKASMLAAEGEFDEAMMNALRNSYRTAPVEGWIASGRVILGLRLFPVLAPELQERVRSDLKLVLGEPPLSQPLVDAYSKDSTLRASAALPLRALSADEMQMFVSMVHSAVRDQ
jgi:hypothetical protein